MDVVAVVVVVADIGPFDLVAPTRKPSTTTTTATLLVDCRMDILVITVIAIMAMMLMVPIMESIFCRSTHDDVMIDDEKEEDLNTPV